MTIEYTLHENNLTSDPHDFMAMVHYTETVDLDAVIDRMIERGSTITKADALAVQQEYYEAIKSLVLDGFKVSTPGATFGVSIKGVFNGGDDTYDANRHTLEGSVNAGLQYRKAIRVNAVTRKEQTIKPRPNLISFIDIASEELNGRITPAGMGKITGHQLKFDQTDAKQGIFFVPAGAASAVRVAMVGQNKPAELMFLTPALPAGDYNLEVRSLFGKSDIRSGALDKVLTVS